MQFVINICYDIIHRNCILTDISWKFQISNSFLLYAITKNNICIFTSKFCTKFFVYFLKTSLRSIGINTVFGNCSMLPVTGRRQLYLSPISFPSSTLIQPCSKLMCHTITSLDIAVICLRPTSASFGLIRLV